MALSCISYVPRRCTMLSFLWLVLSPLVGASMSGRRLHGRCCTVYLLFRMAPHWHRPTDSQHSCSVRRLTAQQTLLRHSTALCTASAFALQAHTMTQYSSRGGSAAMHHQKADCTLHQDRQHFNNTATYLLYCSSVFCPGEVCSQPSDGARLLRLLYCYTVSWCVSAKQMHLLCTGLYWVSRGLSAKQETNCSKVAKY